MTTETRVTTGVQPRSSGVSVLVGSAAAALVAGLGVVVAAGLVEGRTGALSAAIGTAVVVGVLAFGAFVVNAVAGLLPAASLLVALLTYTLQVVLMALVFVALSTTPGPGDDLARGWLGGAVIAGTLAWLVTQLWLATRARIPAYDLPAPAPSEGVEGTAPAAVREGRPGGEA